MSWSSHLDLAVVGLGIMASLGIVSCLEPGPKVSQSTPVLSHSVKEDPQSSSKNPLAGVISRPHLKRPLQPLPKMVKVQVFPEPAGLTLMPLGLHMPHGRALDRFMARLHALKSGTRKRVRLSIWGASHVACDAFTGQLRRRFQKRFGSGGPGFVLPGGPWPSYRHTEIKLGQSKGWRSERLWTRYSRRRPEPRDDLFGVAGISVHALSATAWLEARYRQTAMVAMDIHYLRQPGGGRLEVLQGDTLLGWIFTGASEKKPAFARIELPDGSQRVTFRVAAGEVRLFGVDLESGDPGVVCDALGLNGARSDAVLQWNEDTMTQQVQRLGPDLIVMAYGSNSVDIKPLTPILFARSFDTSLARMRKIAPDTDCLVIGPADQARRRKGEGWVVPDRLDWIIEMQRKVALQRGCAFWDWRAVMGGAQSVFTWIGSDPPLMRSDHLHFFFRGYEVFGDAFFESLMAVWSQYLSGGNPQ